MTARAEGLEERKKQLLKKKRRNRIKRRFVIFVFLLICTGVIFTILKAPFFNVKSIVCVGQQSLSEEQIIKISGARTGVNIFSTGIKEMKRQLVENPSIEECNVRRLYPNKIKIWVREAKIVASVENSGLLLSVNKNGQIIKVEDLKSATTSVARLQKFEPASTKVGEYIVDYKDPVHQKTLECIEVLDKLQMIDKVTSIEAADLSDISIDYEDRLYIMLGSYEKMEYKLTFVKKVISQNLSEYEKAVLDYRGDKLYVGPRTEEEPEVLEEKEVLDSEEADEKEDSSKQEEQEIKEE